MANDNRISATLADQDAQLILSGLADIRTKLPFLVTLTPQERQRLAKMGHKSVGFDDKCIAYMQSNSEFLPGFVSKEEVAKDRTLRTQVMRFAADLNSLAQQVDDTLMAVSNEIWVADLAYYRTVCTAAKRGRPGAQPIADDLGSRFAGQSNKGKAQAATPSTPAAEPVRR